MELTEITVSAGRTFNDPYEQFANYRPSVTLKATLRDGENKDQAVVKLQEQAERLVEENKKRILAALDKRANLQDEIYQKERELDRLKNSDVPF